MPSIHAAENYIRRWKLYVNNNQCGASQGKGVMNTYWLTGRDGYTDKLPDYYHEFQRDNPMPIRLPMTSGKAVDSKVLRPSVESGFNEADEDELSRDSDA